MNSGPTGSTDCAQWTTKLDLYLDGELSDQQMLAFDAHVRSCTSCAADSLSRVQMKRSVKAAGKRFTPSEEFRRRVQRQSGAKPGLPWGFGLRWGMAGALAGLFLAGVLSLGYFSNHRTIEEATVAGTTYNEIADLHVATLASASPVDVVSTDRHTVKPWFQGRIPFAFNLPELQNSEFALLGGRVTYLQQAPGAHLIYELRKHKISVLIFQARPEDSPLPGSASTRPSSFSTEAWTQNGLRYFVIGDAAPEDIRKLAEMFKTAAKT